MAPPLALGPAGQAVRITRQCDFDVILSVLSLFFHYLPLIGCLIFPVMGSIWNLSEL